MQNPSFEFIRHPWLVLEFINWLKAKPEVSQLTSRIILKIHKAQYPIRIKP